MIKFYKYFYLAYKTTPLFNKNFLFKSILNALILFTLIFCISFVILTTSINDGFKKKIINTIISVDGHTRIFNSLNVPLDNKDYLYLIEALNDHDDISVTRNVSQNAILKKSSLSEGIIINSIDSAGYDVFNLNKFLISGGIRVNSIIIGSLLADKLSIEINDEVYIINYNQNKVLKMNVSGIFKTNLPTYDKHVVYGHLSILNDFLGYDSDEFDSIVINTDKFISLDHKYNTDNNKYYSITWETRFDGFLYWLFSYDIPIRILLGFILVISLINISSSIYLNVNNTKKDNEILFILGARKHELIIIHILKTLYISFIGAICSLLFITSFIYFQNRYRLISIPEEIYILSYLPLDFKIYNYIYITLFLLVSTIIIILFSLKGYSFNFKSQQLSQNK